MVMNTGQNRTFEQNIMVGEQWSKANVGAKYHHGKVNTGQRQTFE